MNCTLNTHYYPHIQNPLITANSQRFFFGRISILLPVFFLLLSPQDQVLPPEYLMVWQTHTAIQGQTSLAAGKCRISDEPYSSKTVLL